MGKIKVNWLEGGKSYSTKLRLYPKWDERTGFDWTPMDAKTIKCAFDDKMVIRDPEGLLLGYVRGPPNRLTATMADIEHLIGIGVAEMSSDLLESLVELTVQ